MARISIDPAKIKLAPKFRSARIKFNWPPHHFLGFLCAFWGTVADNNETGEISDWTPDYLAEVVGIGNVDPNELWGVLVECGYIEQRSNGQVFVTDWLDMTEPYLRKKYHNSDPQRLVNIWALYGRLYGREPKAQKTEGNPKEIEPDGPDFLKEQGSFPQGSKKEMPPPHIIKEPPQGRGKDLRGNPSSSPSWETDGKEEGARSAFEIQIPAPEEERRDKKSRPEVNLLQESFRNRFIEYNQGKPVSFSFGEWGKAIKQLLSDGFPPQEIDKRFSFWLASSHPFTQENRKNPRYFYQRFDDLENGPITANQERYGRKPFDDGEGNSPTYKYPQPAESDV